MPLCLKAAPGDGCSQFWRLRQNHRCPKVWRKCDLKLWCCAIFTGKGCWWHVVHSLIKILSIFTVFCIQSWNWSENALYRLIKYDRKIDNVHLQVKLIIFKVCVSTFMKSPLIRHNFISLNRHMINTSTLIIKILDGKWHPVHWAKKYLKWVSIEDNRNRKYTFQCS